MDIKITISRNSSFHAVRSGGKTMDNRRPPLPPSRPLSQNRRHRPQQTSVKRRHSYHGGSCSRKNNDTPQKPKDSNIITTSLIKDTAQKPLQKPKNDTITTSLIDTVKKSISDAGELQRRCILNQKELDEEIKRATVLFEEISCLVRLEASPWYDCDEETSSVFADHSSARRHQLQLENELAKAEALQKRISLVIEDI